MSAHQESGNARQTKRWQLSHGERSRLYMVRALLQRSDLLLLDESFAALDPESLAALDKASAPA